MAISPHYAPKVLYDTKFLQLKQTQAPDGSHPWYYSHRPNTAKAGGVQIVPIIHDNDGDKVVFIETERPPMLAEGIAERCIEVPAGLVGDIEKAETVLQAGKKEVLEETGYEADKIEIKLKNSPSTPGGASEINSYAIADIYKNYQVQEPLSDNGVNKAVHVIPVGKIDEQLAKWQKEGKVISALTLTALYNIKEQIVEANRLNCIA